MPAKILVTIGSGNGLVGIAFASLLCTHHAHVLHEQNFKLIAHPKLTLILSFSWKFL